MTRRRVARPATDYREHRQRWADLVALARRAASTRAGSDLDRLSDKALDGEHCWTPVAPFPRGLVCKNLSRLGWTFGRQTDPALLERMAAPLIAAADMVDDLLAQTEAVAPAAPPVDAEPAPARRLPYADN